MATPQRRSPSFAEVLREGWKPPRARGSAGRPGARRKTGPKGAAAAAAAANGGAVGDEELIKQREELAHRFAELQWDLGGMTYEMASRDHFRLDVLNKQAARLQEVDAQLGQVERVLALEDAGAAGTCPSCGALQARGAVFCWQCGNELKPAAKPGQNPESSSKPEQ
jgi:hypothetical protein